MQGSGEGGGEDQQEGGEMTVMRVVHRFERGVSTSMSCREVEREVV